MPAAQAVIMKEIKQEIRAAADEIGFDLCGFTAPIIEERYRRAFVAAIKAGRHAGMTYLERNLEKRLDPQKLVSGVKTVVCVAASYYQPCEQPDTPGKVAMYAWGRDYHTVIKERLVRLAGRIEEILSREIRYRSFVDTAPVLEKPLAQQAGLGWIGRNGCLINKRLGSYLLLGELFIDAEIDPDQPAREHCGKCHRCIDACPTTAIILPHCVDANRCISYLTIEHNGHIPSDFAARFNGYIFGCDICQNVCPFNRFAKPTRIEEFRDHHLGPHIDPAKVLTWTEASHQSRTANSPANRATLSQWRRNAQLL